MQENHDETEQVAYVPRYATNLGPEWNCYRLFCLWTFTLKLAYAWMTARKLKEPWHFRMADVVLAHAAEQERLLVVWVQHYKPQGSWWLGV